MFLAYRCCHFLINLFYISSGGWRLERNMPCWNAWWSTTKNMVWQIHKPHVNFETDLTLLSTSHYNRALALKRIWLNDINKHFGYIFWYLYGMGCNVIHRIPHTPSQHNLSPFQIKKSFTQTHPHTNVVCRHGTDLRK